MLPVFAINSLPETNTLYNDSEVEVNSDLFCSSNVGMRTVYVRRLREVEPQNKRFCYSILWTKGALGVDYSRRPGS
jgi:hypothetical protein